MALIQEYERVGHSGEVKRVNVSLFRWRNKQGMEMKALITYPPNVPYEKVYATLVGAMESGERILGLTLPQEEWLSESE